jgi:hypothetical protein
MIAPSDQGHVNLERHNLAQGANEIPRTRLPSCRLLAGDRLLGHSRGVLSPRYWPENVDAFGPDWHLGGGDEPEVELAETGSQGELTRFGNGVG